MFKVIYGGEVPMLHHRIVELRKSRKITQEALAVKIGVTRSALSQYELGLRQPDYEIVKNIADYFNVTTDDLLGREVKEKSSAEKLISYLEMELSNEEIKERMTFKVDDITLSSEEVDEFVNFVRVQRLMKKQRTAVSSKSEGS